MKMRRDKSVSEVNTAPASCKNGIRFEAGAEIFILLQRPDQLLGQLSLVPDGCWKWMSSKASQISIRK
jgi:hypothetical protein